MSGNLKESNDYKILEVSWVKETGFETQVKRNDSVAVDSFKAKLPVHPKYCLPIQDAVKKLENDKNFRLVSVRSREEFLGKTSGYTYI